MKKRYQGKGYVNLVKFDSMGYPQCEEHGAMNSVSKNGKVWRCLMCRVGVVIFWKIEWGKPRKATVKRKET